MNSLLCIITLFSLAQAHQLPAPDAKIYRIIFEDGTERYGAVEESGMQIRVYYDTPWAPQPSETILKRKVQVEELTSALRKNRQREEAAKMGYELIQSDFGEAWVRRDEIELADRSKAMLWESQETQAALIENVTPPASLFAGQEVQELETPSLISQYGPHVAVVVLGLALIAFVLKSMVLPG